MESLEKLQEISMRIDHLESAGDWLARSMANIDGAASHTGTLVTVLAEDIRARIMDLVTELEKQIVVSARLQ